MLSKAEVANILTYCRENKVSCKSRIVELGIPEWRFYESKRRYASELTSDGLTEEFLQLSPSSGFVPMSSFSSKVIKKQKKTHPSESRMLNIELKTSSGTMMRIQGELDRSFLQSIILAAGGHVQS